jgi:hypothetical protein
MGKHRVGGVAAACILALAAATPVWASQGGNSNAGDVWLDNVGNPAGPGHEMDPHLACQDINLWGSGLADSSGSFAIDGWPPSGGKEEDYSATWSYDTAKGGDQVVAVINVSQLIATAQHNGDAPKNKQGYHFKLQFSQDPQKHKTFWVDCTSSGPSSPGTTGSPTPTSTTRTTNTTTTTTTATTTVTSTSAPAGSVKGVKVKRHKHKSHRTRGVRRHRRPSRRARRLSGFTG